jgi:hypothetical protein
LNPRIVRHRQVSLAVQALNRSRPPNYCHRYRPVARSAEGVDRQNTGPGHAQWFRTAFGRTSPTGVAGIAGIG